MKKLITYILWGSNKRYWDNIPYLLLANSYIYPDFSMRFYIHRDSIENKNYVFIEQAAKEFENIELELIDIPYQGTKLTTIRMKPLWEEDIDYFFCRDADYALSNLERKSVDYFLSQDQYIVHSIRAYNTCNIILAGLCGFNIKEVFNKIQKIAPTFDDYLKWGGDNAPCCKDWKWQCDQYLLKYALLATVPQQQILDCPQGNAKIKLLDFPDVKTCLVSEYENLELKYRNDEIMQYLNTLFMQRFTGWNKYRPFLGRAWTCRREQLEGLLEISNNEMSEMIKKIIKDKFNESTL